MRQNFRVNYALPSLYDLLRAAGVLGVLAAAALLLPANGQAQGLHADGFHSGETRRALPNGKAAPTVNRPMTSEAVADSIVADALAMVWNQTDAHFHQGEYNHIINLSRIVAQGDPKNVDAYANSAWLLWSMGRSDEAVDILKQGLASNKDTFYFYDELGQHYLNQRKDPKTALTYYEEAVKFKCPYYTWHNLAHCYEKTNQWDKAVRAWESATQYVDDQLAPVRLRRARAELARHQGTGHTATGANETN
ncbi:MAG TPA: tetratricopeptide repeat protein [Chthonomonadaceae bacterium]|nr:tetratricopeptide repeat protein [Chthonomonadaceae bacterium]